VSFNTQGIRFFGPITEVNLYNHYDMSYITSNIEKMYELFLPEISTSGFRINKADVSEITRMKFVSALSAEIMNYFETGSNEFTTKLIGYFTELRNFEKRASKIEIQISNLEREVADAISKEKRESFNSKFKVGNLYRSAKDPFESYRNNKETLLRIKSISEKNVTIEVFHPFSNPIYTKRVSIEESYNLLKDLQLCCCECNNLRYETMCQ
jgi:hypothetical protein